MHNSHQIASLNLDFAGRTNVFRGSFELGAVEKNYEVLDILVTASQQNTANYGATRRTYKLIP